MIRKYREINFTAPRLARIEQLRVIVAEYAGHVMTARQLFYQLVARGLIENTENTYKATTKLIAHARYAGLVDWDAIEDRGRPPIVPSEWRSIDNLVDAALAGFRRPRWHGQPTYCELWVEKQALAGVLEPLADRFHVPLIVNKGYSSASAMKESAERIIRNAGHCTNGDVRVFYLGDHDPSGEDMVRDVRDRLQEFGVMGLAVIKLALTKDQIEEYDPPPNPAKLTDSRAAKYIEEHGEHSWELDALPPDVLEQLVTDAIEEVIDQDALDAVRVGGRGEVSASLGAARCRMKRTFTSIELTPHEILEHLADDREYQIIAELRWRCDLRRQYQQAIDESLEIERYLQRELNGLRAGERE